MALPGSTRSGDDEFAALSLLQLHGAIKGVDRHGSHLVGRRLGGYALQPEAGSGKRRHQAPAAFGGAVREFFRETLALVESSQQFEALAHLDYPKRYWMDGQAPYREEDYEEDLRAILVAAAKRGLVLEVNTTRGHTLCPDIRVLRWWHEVGGKAVQYGSDAHQPDKVAEGFVTATQMVESVGFKPARDPLGLWHR